MNDRQMNIYNNLKNQLDKVARHNRQGSYKTRERYYQANDRFCKYLAKNYGLQKFSNIKNKHVESYVNDMKSRDLSSSTIKTDLGAIRFFADKSGNNNLIRPNDFFDLDKRSFGGVDRSWSSQEYNNFTNLANSRGMGHISQISSFGRYEGLRIHEVLKIDKSQGVNALKTGSLEVIGKGGKFRTVPLSQESRSVLENVLPSIPNGGKVFVGPDEKTHLVIKQVQNFINRNREYFQSEGPNEANITFHGLRHTFAREEYESALWGGCSEYEARLLVSELLGHERDDVTRIYL